MVLDVKLESSPLHHAGWVFAAVVAGVHASTVFVPLSAGVVEAEDVTAARIMRHDVLVMYYPPVFRPDCFNKLREFRIADSRLAEVVHLGLDAVLDQIKTGQDGHGSA